MKNRTPQLKTPTRNRSEHTYPKEIRELERELQTTTRTGRELKRLRKRLEKMKQLYWMVTLSGWIKNLGHDSA